MQSDSQVFRHRMRACETVFVSQEKHRFSWSTAEVSFEHGLKPFLNNTGARSIVGIQIAKKCTNDLGES